MEASLCTTSFITISITIFFIELLNASQANDLQAANSVTEVMLNLSVQWID